MASLPCSLSLFLLRRICRHKEVVTLFEDNAGKTDIPRK